MKVTSWKLQVISFENAYKYSHAFVSVSATIEGQVLTLEIIDDGPGIPADQWELAQQRGIRLDSRPIGQGIGLAVVADLVASYGGELTLHTQPDGIKGAVIRVKLPGIRIGLAE